MDDELQFDADSGLEGTIALICLLGHRSPVGDAGVKNKPVEAEAGEECWVQSLQAAVTFDDDPTSRHGSGVGEYIHYRFLNILKKIIVIHPLLLFRPIEMGKSFLVPNPKIPLTVSK